MQRLSGIGVSPGVVSGRAVILIQREQVLRYRIPAPRVDRELERLEASRTRAREQLTEIRGGVTRRRGRDMAALFDAQLLMLDDPMLVPRAAHIIRDERINAEWAIQRVFHEFSAAFDEIADPYLRERKGDVADLVGRLRLNLRSGRPTPRDLMRELDEASILIADELTPSLAAQVDWTRVRGFATDAGSRTYHTAILARSLEVPAIVGLREASRVIQPGQPILIDGSTGELVADPSDEMVERAARHADDRGPGTAGAGERHGPPATADGVRIRLDANIELPDDLAAARYAGAEGVGLYRSEFLLTGSWKGGAVADEEQQYEIYRGMLEGMAPGSVTIRTFDVDEDQLARPPAGAWAATERSGRQGLRGLRLSLRRPELLRVQLRALLRAACHGQLRVMFPFVSSVDEVREARQIIGEIAAELARRGTVVPRVPVGVMIEIPAAAYTADLMAPDVDFFTIGTNDLIQYSLAVDRADARVSQMYEPLHPAILRTIVMVRRAATRHRIPVSLCGEMASDPAQIALLVGLGLREFSMTPAAIPIVRQAIERIRTEDFRALARRIVRLPTAQEIERELMAALGGLLAGERRP